jgi:DNA-binding FrmR family transcriptional regulator
MDSHTRMKVARRLRSVEGHIRGVLRMLDEEQPCMAVLQQTQALQGSLKQINLLLISSHLEHCLRDVPDETQKHLRTELVSLFNRKA